MSNNFRFIDLFAGIGGIRIPFEELGGECVFSSEWDKYSQMTYEANFGEMTEWLKVLAWNAGVGKPTEGSNPSFTVLFIGLVVDADGRVPVTVDP